MDSNPAARRTAQPLYQPGDLDGFFGLAIDNLIQFLLILSLCRRCWGSRSSCCSAGCCRARPVDHRRQPLLRVAGAAAVGARGAARRHGAAVRHQHGLAVRVRLPGHAAGEARRRARGAERPRRAGRLAGRAGGLSLLGPHRARGALVADSVRRATPRAALLSTLAGIAISFIAIDFAIRPSPRRWSRCCRSVSFSPPISRPADVSVPHSRRRLGGGAGTGRWLLAARRRRRRR